MSFVGSKIHDKTAIVTLTRGKVNALNQAVVDELRDLLEGLECERDVTSIIITGSEKFFSFGFDIPEILSWTKEALRNYLQAFTGLYTYLFLYPKPVVAALNGHAIAGGCMLALACDHRIMVTGKAKIGLNEINFGSSVFAGSTEMLRFWVGGSNASDVLYSGAMYSPEEAQRIGLVHQLISEDNLMDVARQVAADLASKGQPAFASVKSLLRSSIVDEMRQREKRSIKDFVDVWYSESTWANLQKIQIFEQDLQHT